MNESGWHGNLDLVYIHQDKTTRVEKSLMKAPLKVQRPFYPEGKSICHSVTLHTAGGIVGGDSLTQNIHLQNNAQALITTAAAGKIYHSNGQEARQTINITINQDACLEWLPQESIVFNGAIYRQDLHIELNHGANCLLWEITRFGRTARGESFLEGAWRSHTEIWQEGKPLFIDRQFLSGGETTCTAANALAGKSVVASLIWLGKPVSEEIKEKVDSIRHNNQYQGMGGVTFTQSHGLLCRYRGASTTEARSWFMAIWQLLRFSLLERSMIKPRVWQI